MAGVTGVGVNREGGVLGQGSPDADRGHGSNALADIYEWSPLYSRPT